MVNGSLFEGRYGRAVETGDGLLHIEANGARLTMCGKRFSAYTLHWDTKTVVACGACLMEAGVPLAPWKDDEARV